MTLHVRIDETACNGYGNCVVAAPDVFDIDPARHRPGNRLAGYCRTRGE